MRARFTVMLVVALGAAVAAAPASPSASRKFSFRAAGANAVDVQTGEVEEHWTGRAKGIGKITGHVVGWIDRPNATDLVFRGSPVIVDRDDDVLIGACTGDGVLPNPDGHEDWACHATAGTGKFKHSRGQWKMHIELQRQSIGNGTQKN